MNFLAVTGICAAGGVLTGVAQSGRPESQKTDVGKAAGDGLVIGLAAVAAGSFLFSGGKTIDLTGALYGAAAGVGYAAGQRL